MDGLIVVVQPKYGQNLGKATLDTWLLKSSERYDFEVILSHGPQGATLRCDVRLPLQALGKLLSDQCQNNADQDYGDIRKEAAPSVWWLNQWQAHTTPALTLSCPKLI
jgi:hypothetical protein